MRAALLQTKQNKLYNFIDPQMKLDREEAVRLQQEMLEQVFSMAADIEPGCDLIVTTEAINFCGEESALPGSYASYIPRYPGDSLFKRLQSVAQNADAWLVAGVYNRRTDGNGAESCYNSAFIYNRRGELEAIYDKIHLAGTENDNLTPGTEPVVVETDMGKMGVAVCYDMQFPDVCEACKKKGADFMAVPTWGWEARYGYKRIREIQIPVIAAMAVPYWMEIEGERNPSAVVDGECHILAEGSRSRAEIVYGELNGPKPQQGTAGMAKR